ncbi:hypothetical protein SG34_030515 [Thalassomonas viridans]|uniref:Uncharacterized protein n=1 Tax=Thalassomonas viridans TaxID=137584 RepID=A0AAF0CEA0_9GAMM|nr:hypothetical protein [Thalassomonas viridans]WDE09105.1 hypothetical protein SG34_030515 [Thalassomonas viridans]
MKVKFWPLLALVSGPLSQVNAYNPEGDPFADDPFADDPFVNEPVAENNKLNSGHSSRVEFKSYYQDNKLRNTHPFNPGPVKFGDAVSQVSLDVTLESDWQNQWKTRARVYQRYLDNGVKDSNDTYLLEGLVQWQSDNRDLAIEVGRSKPQWSNGYSYDIANMLQPQRSLPYIDQDNALQSKGWDMISGQYFSGPWSFAGYLAASDSRYLDADTEAVLRLGYQQDDAFSLLLHKIDGQDLSYGATYSSLLTDSITFRAEWTRHGYRLMEPLQVNSWQRKQKSNYQRFVAGSTYTAAAGWSLTGEYFYNEHGASEKEWQSLTADAAAGAKRIKQNQSSDPTSDFNHAFAGLAFMGQGWSRERYLSLMFMSAESENLWQLRLSSQISLDDDSQLHRFELLKSFTGNLSARLQWQVFNGCELCEYGLNPSKNNIRLTASWLF